MHYYIDGYNLLFRLSKADGDLQRLRQAIIDDLELKINFIELDATLVFDAQHYEGESIRRHLNHLEIVFTAAGETADEYILQRLQETSNPSKETIATSDKKLAWLSRHSRACTQTVEEFIAWLNRRYRNKMREKSLKKALTLIPLVQRKPAVPPRVEPDFDESFSRPSTNATTEECFSWYLKAFEQSFREVVNDLEPFSEGIQPLYSTPPVGTKYKKKTPKRENPLVSDMERWLQAFDRSLDDETH